MSRGLKHVGAKIQDKIQIVISCDFNNKKRVHFVGIIIVYKTTVLYTSRFQ
jgi:hypothetical protein